MPAMSLSVALQHKLADALRAATPEAYAESYLPVSSVLAEALASQLGGPAAQPRAVPVRVFTSPTSWRQIPLPPALPDGDPTQLIDALARLLPEHFAPRGPQGEGAEAAANTALEAAAEDLAAVAAAATDGAVTAAPSDSIPRVLVHGVRVPLQTPLAWLASACSHPDGWLYVCVRLPTDVTLTAASSLAPEAAPTVAGGVPSS